MTDFPAIVDHPGVSIGHKSPQCICYETAITGGQNFFTSGAYPAVSKCIFMPITLQVPILVKQFWYYVNTSSGNIDIGVYDIAGNRKASAGSTAMAGASVVTAIDVTDFELDAGNWFLGISVDNTTAALFRSALPASAYRASGVQEQLSTFPLANPATFANPTSAYLPVFGL